MKDIPKPKASLPTVLSLAELLEQQPPTPPPSLVEPGLLPAQGIWFVGGEPKVGKSLLVANLALALAAGSNRIGFPVPAPRRVLVCQFELPLPQFVNRLLVMRRNLGPAADHHLLVDTRATGHLLSAPQGLNHFVVAVRAAAAEVIVLDPLYPRSGRKRHARHGSSLPSPAPPARGNPCCSHRGPPRAQVHHPRRNR
jgi:AAA domain